MPRSPAFATARSAWVKSHTPSLVSKSGQAKTQRTQPMPASTMASQVLLEKIGKDGVNPYQVTLGRPEAVAQGGRNGSGGSLSRGSVREAMETGASPGAAEKAGPEKDGIRSNASRRAAVGINGQLPRRKLFALLVVLIYLIILPLRPLDLCPHYPHDGSRTKKRARASDSGMCSSRVFHQGRCSRIP